MPPEYFATQSASVASPGLNWERKMHELAILLEVNRALVSGLSRDDLFGALARSLQKLLPTHRFGIELPFEGDKLRGHLLTPRGDSFLPTEPHELPGIGTACHWVIQNRQWMIGGSTAELRERFPTTFTVMQREGMESVVAIPLITGGRCLGALFCMAAPAQAYAGLHQEFLDQVAGAVAVAVDNVLAHEEVQRLSDRLAAENAYLQEEIRGDHNFEEIVGNSPALRRMLDQVERVAQTDSTVLLLGETGTGKELVARAVHNRSRRRDRPLVKVNCGAIAANLVESELFGHVKGAFTGAFESREGRFKLADGGTIFLDEIGELTFDLQVKLLRVLQEQEFEPIGSSRSVKVDVRVVAATNRDLTASIAAGTFRRDLYYRLNVFPITLPPLRARPGDIPLLVHYFVARFAMKIGRKITRVLPDAMQRLVSYPWPGNVRELENVIERAVILSQGPDLHVAPEMVVEAAAPAPVMATAPAVPRNGASAPMAPVSPTSPVSLEEVARQHIMSVLKQTQWRIEGPQGAANALNMQPSTLRSRLKKLGIQRRA